MLWMQCVLEKFFGLNLFLLTVYDYEWVKMSSSSFVLFFGLWDFSMATFRRSCFLFSTAGPGQSNGLPPAPSCNWSWSYLQVMKGRKRRFVCEGNAKNGNKVKQIQLLTVYDFILCFVGWRTLKNSWQTTTFSARDLLQCYASQVRVCQAIDVSCCLAKKHR